MREERKILVSDAAPDPEQPRKDFGEGELLKLGKNMLALGQLVPVIVYMVATLPRYVLLDGERRWRAAQLVGIKELLAIVLPERPTALALRILQMSIEVHKIGLSAMERSDFLTRIRTENNWSVNELADALSMSQPLVSKLLGLQRLCAQVRELFQAGELDIEKAYVICQEPDHAKQVELAKQATALSRQQLRRQARGISPSPEQTMQAATFALPGDTFVTVKGEGLALALVIDVLQQTVKQLRKGRDQGWDITTQQQVMRDQAKAHRQSAPQQQQGHSTGKVG